MSDVDEYARERENLIEGDPIVVVVVDELLELRRIVAEQGYEYAVEWKEIGTGTKLEFEPYFWYTEKEARATLADYNEQAKTIVANGGKMYYTGQIVKRRKAGKPGKVEKV